jgi:serine phosphatase RsbU (regulator of sigma subunit)
MCIATLDCDNRILRYANAGIPYPVLKRSEKIDELQSNGLPLGGLAQAEYEETPPRALEAGDVLVFFTDGITEAQSKNNTDRYYIEAPRLQTLAGGFNSEMKAGAMIDEIFADVGKFSGVTHQNDDMTIVVVKVL